MMEYKENTRTKNLSLRDIHVGDWVQAWDHITKRYTPPERITAIHDDGIIYTKVDPEQGDPFEYDISEIDALPITPDLLLGFGFEKVGDDYFFGIDQEMVIASDNQLDVMDVMCLDCIEDRTIGLGDMAYMHELQQALYSEPRFIGKFEPKWKGFDMLPKKIYLNYVNEDDKDKT